MRFCMDVINTSTDHVRSMFYEATGAYLTLVSDIDAESDKFKVQTIYIYNFKNKLREIIVIIIIILILCHVRGLEIYAVGK